MIRGKCVISLVLGEWSRHLTATASLREIRKREKKAKDLMANLRRNKFDVEAEFDVDQIRISYSKPSAPRSFSFT